MKSKVVLGAGDMLQIVSRAWSETSANETVRHVEIPQTADYAFDLRAMDELDPATTLLFVAFDERFGNFKRAELMQMSLARGFQLGCIQALGAVVASDAKLGPNVFVGHGAIVSSGASVSFNSVIHAGAIVDFGARIKASCWIDSGVLVGRRAEIGAHSTLRAGVVIAPSVAIGRYCEIGVPGLYRTNVEAKTVLDPRYDEPLVVCGG